MAHCTFKSDREMSIDELREVLVLMEQQVTTDREEDTVMSIRGNYADIDVSIDDDGDVTLL